MKVALGSNHMKHQLLQYLLLFIKILSSLLMIIKLMTKELSNTNEILVI